MAQWPNGMFRYHKWMLWFVGVLGLSDYMIDPYCFHSYPIRSPFIQISDHLRGIVQLQWDIDRITN